MKIDREKQMENILTLIACIAVMLIIVLYVKYLPEVAFVSAALFGW